MRARLAELLATPVFEDREKTRLAVTLHRVLLGVLAVAVLNGLLAFVLAPDSASPASASAASEAARAGPTTTVRSSSNSEWTASTRSDGTMWSSLWRAWMPPLSVCSAVSSRNR